MSDFDLDVSAEQQQAGDIEPMWESKSVCTPGCITGIMHCTTRNCNFTNGCSISK